MGFLVAGVLFLTFLLTAQTAVGQEVRTRYAEAVRAFNAGRIAESRSLLEKLFADHPDYYRGYRVLWDAIGRTQDADARRAAAERDLKLFEQAPADKRDEDFYSNFTSGYEILGNKQRIADIEAECIAKFPRGLLAQKKRLDAARAAEDKDPVKSAELYAAYLKEFDENVSWTELAAHGRFSVIENHPEKFDGKALLFAAEENEYRSKQFIRKFGNPASHFARLREIVAALVERDPEAALNYARRGLAFIQEQWPLTSEIKESFRMFFWPHMMRAHLALKEWKQAAAIGEALVREIEAGTIRLPATDETAARLNYATALESIGAAETARVQREVAGNPERNRERREQQLRDALLARRQQKPAAPFKLKDLNGKTVSLADFRGKTLVLAFWATWCGPCIGELDELKSVFDQYKQKPEVALLTVSTDADKDAVPKLAKERGYQFPVLLSDGSVEEPYQTQSIPQLYVIDPAGNIRFHETGYVRDGFYRKKIDWMIEAALK